MTTTSNSNDIDNTIVHTKFTAKIRNTIRTKLESTFRGLILDSCFLSRNKRINAIFVFFILSLTCWTLMYLTLNDKALPGGVYFSLFVLIVSCHIVGYLFELIKLPNLLGINRYFVVWYDLNLCKLKF